MAFRRDKVIAAAERYSAKGQHSKAAKSYQSIVDHDPKDTRTWLLLADCLVRAGDTKQAIEKYTQVAKFFAQAKDFQKALAVYRQVLNIDEGRLDIQIRCAELLREMGRVADSIAMYERTAHAHMQAGNSVDAFAIYRLVIQLEPTQITKRLRLAELLSRDGI
ncbi:MAG: tetratricopeptide repeat protein, partial [Nannocystaceae bacterium]